MSAFLPEILNLFEILRPLGQGGRGEVTLARRKLDGRILALKTLPKGSAESARLFRDEVALLSRLSHPNLVRIEDYFEGPPPAYVMEFVDGSPLNVFLSRADPDAVMNAFVGCCRGLHYLHARGLLHRDLKPANILVTAAGEPKLLDFGLPGWGTPAYWAPEAKAGRYDGQSDLYSLGLSFLESLEGRIDLPEFFRELLVRLVKEDPSERPSSALSLIKFLNRHVPSPYVLAPEEATQTILSKVPWVSRPEEGTLRRLEDEGRVRVVLIEGPTGVGRSRFVEETAWRRKLAGEPCLVVPDVHRKSEDERKELEVAVRAALRNPRNLNTLILVEYDPDLMPPTARSWVEGLSGREDAQKLEIKDLPRAKAEEFVRRATEDNPLPKEEARAIVRESGGRPLLLIEALRQIFLSPGKRGEIPKTLEAASAARVKALGEGARRLLALLVTAREEAGLKEAGEVWPGDARDFHDAAIDLRSQGFLGTFSEDDRGSAARLAHAGLAESYRHALGPEVTGRAHRLWIEYRTRGLAEPATIAHAPSIVRHALACGDVETARRWGRGAVEFLFGAGRFEKTVALCDVLLPIAQERLEKVILQGHRAPSLYRLGLFEEALKSYDDWFATKGDDETRVETVKHTLFTGQTLMAAGRAEEARARFEKCLETGDAGRHAALRTYHARAHALLASLFEKNPDEAKKHLEAASALSENAPLLLAEIENQKGLLEQTRGFYDRARASFESAARAAARAENSQSEAIAWNHLGMLERERGDFRHALGFMDRALELSRAGGEKLQTARYRQNRALVLKDLARLGEAFSEMAASHDLLAVYGNADERRLSAIHLKDLEELSLDEGVLGLALTPEEIEDRDGPRFRAWGKILAFDRGPVAERTENEFAEAVTAIAVLESPLLRVELFARLADTLKRSGLTGLADRVSGRARGELALIHRQLPEEMQWTTSKPAA